MSFSDIKMEKDANRTMPFQEKKNKNAKFIGNIQNKMLILLIKKAQPRETDIEKALLEWLRRMNICPYTTLKGTDCAPKFLWSNQSTIKLYVKL